MAVEVGFSNFGGTGAKIVTAFSDPLTTLDPQGSGIGSNWIQAVKTKTPITDPIASSNATIGVSSLDAINALLWSGIGSINTQTVWRSYALPVPPYLGCLGKIQFSQCTMVQTTTAAGTLRGGLIVGCYGAHTGFTGYHFNVLSTDKSWQLAKFTNDTAVVMDSAVGPMANGDVFRLSLDLSVGGQATVAIKRNGTTLSSQVDAAAILNFGSPGLACTGQAIGGSTPKSDWRTFSCGIGL